MHPCISCGELAEGALCVPCAEKIVGVVTAARVEKALEEGPRAPAVVETERMMEEMFLNILIKKRGKKEP